MIRVMIERKIKAGHEREFWEILMNLRRNALLLPGYVSGEWWVDESDSLHLIVFSTWQRLEEWLAWKQSPDRKIILATLEPLLAEPAIETVMIRPSGISEEAKIPWQAAVA